MLLLIPLMELCYAALLLSEPHLHIAPVIFIFAALFGCYAATIFLMRKRKIGLWVVIAAAIVFRLTVVPLGNARANLFLDDDVWRYLWDGHVTAQSGNPYRAAPNQIAASGIWRVIRSRVNHPDLPTIYPPAAQAFFFAAHELAPGSVVALKLLLIGCDVACIMILAACLRRLGRSASDVVLYAWNPLVIVMFACAAHIDVLMLLFLGLTAYFALCGWRAPAGVALGMSVLVKFAPLVLFPLLLHRLGKRATAMSIIVIAIPLLLLSNSLSTFVIFARNWDFNSASFFLLRAINGTLFARVVSGTAILALATWIAFRDSPFADGAADTLGTLVLLSPTVMPWYATWPLVFAPISRRPATWLWFSAFVCLSFPMTMQWTTDPFWLTLEYGGFAAVVLLRRLSAATFAMKDLVPKMGVRTGL